MFQTETIKYPEPDDFYEGLVQWLEMEREYELSELDINKMEREQISRSLTEQNRIISNVALNNKDYDNSKTGA